ncbi:RHS repeat-associated core domain-containing protein, partial [Pseudomonas sp. GM60]|uniref:RHS repeat-associated core domain-containing protein n=1 Tax=Pseudomonas sp. GM60 TaxID=1144334 RepID=UPI003083A7AE
VLMRFNGPDSFSPFGRGGLNTYAYCLGDPINLSDPNGTIPDFLKRMLGWPVYKSGPERPPNTPAEHIYTEVAEFTPASDIHEWHEMTFRTSQTNGGKIAIKAVTGLGYDGATVYENKELTTIKRNRPIKLNELVYAQMPGNALAIIHENFDMPEVNISNDHRNLLEARNNLIITNNESQLNALALQGRLNGVRPKNAEILIRDIRTPNDGDRWWADPTRYHTVKKWDA